MVVLISDPECQVARVITSQAVQHLISLTSNRSPLPHNNPRIPNRPHISLLNNAANKLIINIIIMPIAQIALVLLKISKPVLKIGQDFPIALPDLLAHASRRVLVE